MLNNITQLLIDVFVQGFAGILLFRFLMHWLRAPMRNPVGEFVMALSDFVVLRARRYIPSVWRLDSATFLLAFLVELFYLSLTYWLRGYPVTQFPLMGLSVLTLISLFKLSIYFLMVALLLQAVLSWVSPYNALAPFLNVITQRFLQPIRRIVPLIGHVDLSPLILLVICQIILFAPVAMMEEQAMHLFR